MLQKVVSSCYNPLNAELNPICYLLALLGAHHFLHVSRIRVKSLIPSVRYSEQLGFTSSSVDKKHPLYQTDRRSFKIFSIFNVHGSVHRKNTLMYIPQDATLHSLFYLETALHVSGGTTTHHQERKQLYLQHLVFITPLLLPA